MIEFAMDHLEHAELAIRKETMERLAVLLFPWDRNLQAYMWQTRGDITITTLWGHENMQTNATFAMIKEKLGLGPKYYWIIGSQSPIFSQRLFCLSRMLPWEKFCITPETVVTLNGPFLQESRKEMAAQIIRNTIPPQEISSSCSGCVRTWCFCQESKKCS